MWWSALSHRISREWARRGAVAGKHSRGGGMARIAPTVLLDRERYARRCAMAGTGMPCAQHFWSRRIRLCSEGRDSSVWEVSYDGVG